MIYRPCNIVGMIVIAGLSFAAYAFGRQQKPASGPPDFFVRLAQTKSIFYHDEAIDAGVLRRLDKPERAGCSFGMGGKLQLLKNGQLIYEYEAGPVSMTGVGSIDGVKFQYRGGGMHLSLALKDEVDPKDNYQIRATCGPEVSEPSAAFHLSPWPHPVGGLTVYAKPIKPEFLAGEPIMVEVTMKNTGLKPVRCPAPRADDGYTKPFWLLEPYWKDPKEYHEDDPQFERTLQVLQPEEIKTAIFNLSNFSMHPAHKTPPLGTQPGTFQVWFSVFFHQEDEDIPSKYREHLWRAELTSNVFKIVIK